jgi:hydroxymethylpyrimidine kinase/phosphomethylpyrimidine kinase/thiamine-phosphate diphosphorylase
VLTPNVHEVQMLTGYQITSHADLPRVAKALLALGVKQVILKGGHCAGGLAQDYWTDGKQSFWLSTPRLECGKTHGTGCVFSASLASFLAKEESITDAFVQAKMVLTQSLQSELRYHGVTFAKLTDTYLRSQNIPWLSYSPLVTHKVSPFLPCMSNIGLYPIVEDANWVAKALTWNIDSLQLRIKNKSYQETDLQIKQAVLNAKQGSFQLFINDYWSLALKHHAYGVHLGQEDLNDCDIELLKKSNIRLGLSTHSYTELARAVALQPSYIAFGPIHATTTKVMCFLPQGIERLKVWRSLVSTQLIAIGGLNLSNIQAAVDCGVDGVSVVSAITKASDPRIACQQLMAKFNRVPSYV